MVKAGAPLVVWLLVMVVVVVVTTSAQRTDVETDSGELACASGYVYLADRCYKFHQVPQPRSQARRNCESESADLASVVTEAQYTALLAHMNANYAGTYWTSGIASGGRWVWETNGEEMASQWWGRSPSTSANQCAYFCSNTHKYWDKACSRSLRYICEKQPELTFSLVEPEVERLRGLRWYGNDYL